MIERILFVGDLGPYCRTYQRFRALKELGYEVEGVTITPVDEVPGVSRPKFWARVFHKLDRPLDRTGANAKMLESAARFQPDLVFIERGTNIRPATLRRLRELCKKPVVLVSYSEDDMFARHNQSVYYRACVPLYDVFFTTKSYNCDPGELPAMGARRVVFVDKAYDKHAHRPIELTADDLAQYSAEVGFVGTFEENRAAKMLMLANQGFDVRVWGNGWRSWSDKHPKLRVENRPVYNDDYVKALCASKINLCFLRKANRDLQTDRTMELPACGAFMLAERTDEHRRLFEEGREAAYFDIESDAELVERVRYYLDHNEERRAVAAAGRRRAVNSGYSHHERLAWMLNQVAAPEDHRVAVARSV